MKVLICGGFGYIGSQLLYDISKNVYYDDWDITVIDNWSYGRGMPPVYEYFKERINKFQLHCLDISDNKTSSKEILTKEIAQSEFIINLCSLTQIPDTFLHEKYILYGVKNLAELIKKYGERVKKIIDISSTSIYGSAKKGNTNWLEPYSEEVYPNPETSLHNYASNKLLAEKVWQSEDYNSLPFTSLRLSTNFGYSIGMRYNLFINEFLINSISGRKTVIPGAPDNYRPFIHVSDTAGIILYLLENCYETNGLVLNIGDSNLNPQLGELFKDLDKLLVDEYDISSNYHFAVEDDKKALQESYIIDFKRFNSILDYSLKYDFISGSRHFLESIISNKII